MAYPPCEETTAFLLVAVRRLLADPGRRHQLVATLAAALDETATRCGRGGPMVPAHDRSGEADAVALLAYVIGPTVGPGRYDELTRDAIADVVTHWVMHPTRPVDAPLALAGLLAAPVELAGGWTAVTDDELRDAPNASLLSWFLTRPDDPARWADHHDDEPPWWCGQPEQAHA